MTDRYIQAREQAAKLLDDRRSALRVQVETSERVGRTGESVQHMRAQCYALELAAAAIRSMPVPEAESGETAYHRVLVCGSRNATDHRPVWDTLDKLHPTPDLIIQGGAGGVDEMARDWTTHRGIACATFHAAWRRFDKPAGPIRNGWMLTHGRPTLVLAFPGGSGTENMVERATRHDVPVQRITAALDRAESPAREGKAE